MRIHFIGIGGIGVSALAQYYLEKGAFVSGSDLVSSENTSLLEEKGALISIGPNKDSNLPENLNLVVYSPAVKEDNPELKRAREKDIKVKSYPEALGDLTRTHFTIAVSGTHGKSTTSSMAAMALIEAGLDPTVIIGTKLKEFGNSNFRAGKSKYLVIEADEHFASFLNYNPDILILTNIEKDHLDYYKNLENILESFKKYFSLLKKGGTLILNEDDKNISKINLPSGEFKVLKYSLKQKESKELKEILKVPGEHNVYNALSVLTMARELGIPDKITLKALSNYKGSWRRFEIKHNKDFLIVSDYGHHPTEVLATLKAAREKWPKRKIYFIFQPHQYQRTFYLFEDFLSSFKESIENNFFDKAIITDIFDVAGRESQEIKEKISSEMLTKKINSDSVSYLKREQLKSFLKDNLKKGDVVLIMGAGEIYKLADSMEVN
jgi:UDP-N-acetylmuramate--alanine ligase